MMKSALLGLGLLGLLACGKEEAKGQPGSQASEPKPVRPATVANGEPAVVEVKHILIQFQGAHGSEATRSREEAEKLAYEALRRARSGEDFDLLVRSLSEDPGSKEGKPYTLTNHGIEAVGEEMPRAGMAKEFADVSFRIGVGEIAFAPYDPDTCQFGYHIIKRVK